MIPMHTGGNYIATQLVQLSCRKLVINSTYALIVHVYFARLLIQGDHALVHGYILQPCMPKVRGMCLIATCTWSGDRFKLRTILMGTCICSIRGFVTGELLTISYSQWLGSLVIIATCSGVAIAIAIIIPIYVGLSAALTINCSLNFLVDQLASY